jgi:hypothetical protein
MRRLGLRRGAYLSATRRGRKRIEEKKPRCGLRQSLDIAAQYINNTLFL